jgi:predicted nucleotidyltransferase component of viral defense system
MYFHLNKEEYEEFIKLISERANLDEDIIEKDYFVCTILKELAKEQDYLKAYFKGGTAVYKILDKMNRFSEDIDLTVEVVAEESNNSNKTRLKKSALGYKIPELELQNDKTIDVKQSVTAFYKYDTLFQNINNPLHKVGEIQVEATSFTISEPVELYEIEPIIYKYATEEERKVLKDTFNIDRFEIKVQKLERIFIDKIFASEFYYERKMYVDFSKHIYDISILLKEDRIKKLLENKEHFRELANYKKQEESVRKGGVDSDKKISEFEYLDLNFNDEINKAFDSMQNKYIYKEEYKLDINDIKEALKELKNKIRIIEGEN